MPRARYVIPNGGIKRDGNKIGALRDVSAVIACYAKMDLDYRKNRTFCTKERAKNIENEKNTKKRNFFQKGYLQNGFCVVNYGKNNFTGIGIFCVFFTKIKGKTPREIQR